MPTPRRLIAVVLPFIALLAGAASAQARIVELGRAGGAAPASCPTSPCLAVSRTTGYQEKLGSSTSTYVVPANGRIVAWTIGLGAPNAKQIAFFNNAFGPASAGITVLRVGKKKLQRFNVGQGPIVNLQPYFGQVAQFPLGRTLRVHKGDIVALSVPTWAPALSQLLSDGSTWFASRPRGACDNTDTQTVQDKPGPTRYRCKYAARLTYSATLVTSAQPTSTPAS
jgi:hypothetical protein